MKIPSDLAVSGIPRTESGAATPDTWAEKFESLKRISSIRETISSFDSCNSCERLGTSRHVNKLVLSRSHELHELKLLLVSLIEFIRSKLFNFSAHVLRAGKTGRPVGCSHGYQGIQSQRDHRITGADLESRRRIMGSRWKWRQNTLLSGWRVEFLG